MNRSIDEQGSDPHAVTLELLPWLVNGTADEQPLAAARAHLADCAECRASLKFDERLADAMRDDRVVDYAPHASWARFAGRLDAEQARRGRWQVWRKPWSSLLPSSRERVVRFALVAQLAIIVGLAAGLVVRSGDFAAPREYRTLSLPETPVQTSDAMLLRLVVDEAMSAEALRELLAASNAKIVDGPTELGVFTIAIPRASAGADDPVVLARQMRARVGVRFAEPVMTRIPEH
jgi:hypothetical protein